MKPTVSPKAAENLTTLLMRSNYDDLTPETLLAAFQAEGVRSLEDLTQRMTDELQKSNGQPQPIPYDSLFAPPSPEFVAQIEHPIPQVPIVVNGVTYAPEEITRFNGREIGYIPQDGGRHLLLLTDRDAWVPFVKSALLARAVASSVDRHNLGGFSWSRSAPALAMFAGPTVVVGGPTTYPPQPWIGYFEHYECNGDGVWLDSGESRTDLRCVGSWPFKSDFNDTFSSYSRSTGLSMAWEHIHFTGDWLWTGPNATDMMDLRWVGWNDRISSIINSG